MRKKKLNYCENTYYICKAYFDNISRVLLYKNKKFYYTGLNIHNGKISSAVQHFLEDEVSEQYIKFWYTEIRELTDEEKVELL